MAKEGNKEMKKEEIKSKKEKFLSMRAIEGKSLQSIANELNISKTTLIKWNKELENEIINLKNIEKDRILEEYKITVNTRLEALLLLRQKILEELQNRPLEKIPYQTLINSFMQLEKAINKNIDVIFYTGKEKGIEEEIKEMIEYETVQNSNRLDYE